MKALKILGIVIASLLLVAILGVLAMTQTDWGRERVRRVAVGAIADAAHGIVRVGQIRGNLLTGVTLVDLSITDSAGRPFLSVDTARVRYRIRDLIDRRIALDDVRLVRPIIVLEEWDDEWNYERIFPGDTTPSTDTLPGFGDWIAITDLTIVDGRVLVRTEWEPDGERASLDSVVAAALAGETRKHIVRRDGGYQQVMDFRALNGEFPRVRIADPDSAIMVFDVSRASLLAEPFRPPAAEVRELAGVFLVGRDSLWFDDVRVTLPGSKLAGSGTYVLNDTLGMAKGDMVLRVRGAPVALADLRWLYPPLPSRGEGTLDFAMLIRGDTSDFVARNAEIAVDRSRLAGDFGLRITSEFEFHDTNLRFTNFDTRLIEQLAPSVTVPRRGTLDGRAALAGTLAALNVNADVAFDDAAGGTSVVSARGELGVAHEHFRARDLRIELRPLQVDLATALGGTQLPVSGTVRGTATLNGSTATRLLAQSDLVHEDRGARSHLVGGGAFSLARGGWMDVRMRATPLSLATVGRFVPAARLHGVAAGDIQLRGAFRDLAVRADLRLPDGGVFLTTGTLDVASRELGYDLTTALRVFDLRSVTAIGPRTTLTALASARGRGLDPATMRATFAADLSRSAIDSVAVDSVHARVAIADGIAHVDSFFVRLPFARARVDGRVGLAAGRSGRLVYDLQVDSLEGFRRWLPALDTGRVEPRPGRIAEAMKRAREDSARLARATEIERMATGGEPPPLRADTAGLTLRRDTLAGAVFAAGTLEGSIQNFQLRGRAAVSDLVYGGNAVGRGRVEYAVLGGGTPRMSIAAGAGLESVQAAGFALDSLDTRVFFQRPRGTVELAIYQDTLRDYRARADFALHLDHSELHLDRVALRFDTTTWRSVRPGTIQWGARGLAFDEIELRSGTDGRIYVDGRVPAAGSAADLQLAINGLEVGHITQLLQSDVPLTGMLSMQGRVSGTQRNPRARIAIGLTNPTYGGTAVPDVRGTIQYADATLVTEAQLNRGNGRPLLVANASLPVNLALAGVTGSRLLDRPMEVNVRADSMPLDVLPQFTDAVAEVRGRLIGVLAARGTPGRAVMTGAAALDFASFRVVPMGVTYRDLFGAVRLRGDTLVIDSLVGRAGGGRVRIAGGIATADLARPGFDLEVTAERALVLDNEIGRIRSNAELEVRGPFDGVRVTGHAEITDGVIYIPEESSREVIGAHDPDVFNVIDTSVVAERELLPAQSPLMENLQVDVSLHIARDTWVRGRDANVEIYTSDPGTHEGDLRIHVNRQRSALAIDGRVNTDRGEYTFLGRRFILRQGSATFIGEPEINPLLQITGAHEVRLPGREALEIRVIIGGTMRRPKIALESTAQPPLSQTDLLSYLAFGQSSSSLLQVEGSTLSGPGSGSGHLVGNVAGLAARQLAAVAIGVAASEAERDLGRSIGADVVNIAPADVPAEISGSSLEALLSGTEIEVGRYLNRQTFVALQARPTAAVPGIRVQHRMPKGFRIEASYEPRILLTQPTLSRDVNLTQTRVFGGFLIREWRF